MREIAIGREEGKVRVDGNRGEWDVIWCGKEEVEEERKERKGKKKKRKNGHDVSCPYGKNKFNVGNKGRIAARGWAF